MALSKKILDALNEQFNEELKSAYLYDSMAADFYDKNFSGFGVWMTKQAAEEREHAEKIHRYVDENGGRIFYGTVEAPQAAWDSPLEAFKAAAGHEKYISGRIHDLVRLARSEDDIATEHFLAWFVNEQVEEESNAQGWIDKISMLGENIVGLYTLNREAAERA